MNEEAKLDTGLLEVDLALVGLAFLALDVYGLFITLFWAVIGCAIASGYMHILAWLGVKYKSKVIVVHFTDWPYPLCALAWVALTLGSLLIAISTI